MKARRSRSRLFLKWTGLVVCVLVGVVWIGSFFVQVYPNWLKAETTWFGGVGRGFVECYYPAGVLVSRTGMWFRGAFKAHWWPIFTRTTVGGRTCWYVGLPLWMIFVVVATPTAILWDRDRRPPAGHCQTCGYDLTGNVSGKCPECGEPT